MDGTNSVEHDINEDDLNKSPRIYLAHVHGAQGDNILLGQKGVRRFDRRQDGSIDKERLKPALLVSYVYLEKFLKMRQQYCYRDWVLDSGAFSAYNSGTEIKLQDYIDCCKQLLATDPTLTEIYSLDVIGDYKASRSNTEEMWKQGVEAIPCFHVGSPENELKAMAKDYPKIALGGVALMNGQRDKKFKWAQQCFARVWPKPIHGFAFSSENMVMSLPWHSVDATSWEIGPCKFGRWQAFGNMSVRGSKQNLRAEVEWYLRLEQRARTKWKKQMNELDYQPKRVTKTCNPAIRLAVRASRPPKN